MFTVSQYLIIPLKNMTCVGIPVMSGLFFVRLTDERWVIIKRKFEKKITLRNHLRFDFMYLLYNCIIMVL